MPYNDNTQAGWDLYIDILSQLQCLIDSSHSDLPIIVLGDLNTALPNTESLPRRWFQSKLYNKRSALLYNFVSDNNLCVANYAESQHVRCTYRKGTATSYIDYILIPLYDAQYLSRCFVHHNDDLNTSDHYAAPNLPRQFWQDTAYQRRYTELLDYALGRLEKTVYSLDNLTEETASSFVNNLYGELKKAIYDASSQCSDEYIKQQPKGRKVWWTKDCTQARKRSRLFFHIWKSIGRPSSGATYQCYNKARKNYRCTCRCAVHKGCSKNYRLMDLLYKQNHAGCMWNLIRKSKNSSHSANPKVMDLSTLETYFGNKFKAHRICDTDREAFEKTFLKHKNFIPYDNFTLSYIKVKNYIKQLKMAVREDLIV